jgi:hypothetical protein
MARVMVGSKAMPSTVVRVLLGLLPLWILLVQAIAFPGWMDPVFANPPAMAGLPAGVVLVAAVLALMATGVEVLRRTSSNGVALLAFLGLTLPSAALIVAAPALMLYIQNA